MTSSCPLIERRTSSRGDADQLWTCTPILLLRTSRTSQLATPRAHMASRQRLAAITWEPLLAIAHRRVARELRPRVDLAGAEDLGGGVFGHLLPVGDPAGE